VLGGAHRDAPHTQRERERRATGGDRDRLDINMLNALLKPAYDAFYRAFLMVSAKTALAIT
jgi:hypothetical protein